MESLDSPDYSGIKFRPTLLINIGRKLTLKRSSFSSLVFLLLYEKVIFGHFDLVAIICQSSNPFFRNLHSILHNIKAEKDSAQIRHIVCFAIPFPQLYSNV